MIVCDVVAIYNFVGELFRLLEIIDRATIYHIGDLIKSREPQDVFDLINRIWLIPFGLPLKAACDQDGSFQAEFADNFNQLGILLEVVPAGAHNQIGVIERHDEILRKMVEKTVDATQAITEPQMRMVIISCFDAKNSSYRRCGRSPAQAVFGRDPRLPDGLLHDEEKVRAIPDPTQEQRLDYSEMCRIESRRAFLDVETDTALRAAINRQTCAKDNISHLEVGSRIGFYVRQSRHGLRRKAGGVAMRPGYLIGTLVGREAPPEKNLLIAYGRSQHKVAPELCRPAWGYENYVPDPADIDRIRAAERAVEKNLTKDIHSEPPGEDEPREPHVVLDPLHGRPVSEEEQPLILAVPPPPVEPPRSSSATASSSSLPVRRERVAEAGAGVGDLDEADLLCRTTSRTRLYSRTHGRLLPVRLRAQSQYLRLNRSTSQRLLAATAHPAPDPVLANIRPKLLSLFAMTSETSS